MTKRRSLNPTPMIGRFVIRCCAVVFPITFVTVAWATYWSPWAPIEEAKAKVGETKTEIVATRDAAGARIEEAKTEIKDKQADRKERLTAYSNCVKENDYKLDKCEHLNPKAKP